MRERYLMDNQPPRPLQRLDDQGRRSWPSTQRIQWVTAIVLASILIQFGLHLDRTLIRRGLDVWANRHRSAIERSALFQVGEDFRAYVEFVRKMVPAEPDAKVILPHRGLGGPLSYVTFMQYFFFPRKVDNCHPPLEACVLNLTGQKTSILAVSGFPPMEAALQIKAYIPFREGDGLFVPPGYIERNE